MALTWAKQSLLLSIAHTKPRLELFAADISREIEYIIRQNYNTKYKLFYRQLSSFGLLNSNTRLFITIWATEWHHSWAHSSKKVEVYITPTDVVTTDVKELVECTCSLIQPPPPLSKDDNSHQLTRPDIFQLLYLDNDRKVRLCYKTPNTARPRRITTSIIKVRKIPQLAEVQEAQQSRKHPNTCVSFIKRNRKQKAITNNRKYMSRIFNSGMSGATTYDFFSFTLLFWKQT